MKLVKQDEGSLKYTLNETEADMLTMLLKKFPFTEIVPVKISKTDQDPKVAEREKLLNESLADHRKKLKKQAKNLLIKKFRKSGECYLLSISSEEREILLQILNDIRIGCWIALGKPDTTELEKSNPSAQEFAHYGLMNLAGYFESQLIDQE